VAFVLSVADIAGPQTARPPCPGWILARIPTWLPGVRKPTTDDIDLRIEDGTETGTATMSPHTRADLDQHSDDIGTRWAIHLRKLVDRRKLSFGDFVRELASSGLDVSPQTVKAWLRGRRLPRVGDLEIIAQVLKVADYRKILPPPKR